MANYEHVWQDERATSGSSVTLGVEIPTTPPWTGADENIFSEHYFFGGEVSGGGRDRDRDRGRAWCLVPACHIIANPGHPTGSYLIDDKNARSASGRLQRYFKTLAHRSVVHHLQLDDNPFSSAWNGLASTSNLVLTSNDGCVHSSLSTGAGVPLPDSRYTGQGYQPQGTEDKTVSNARIQLTFLVAPGRWFLRPIHRPSTLVSYPFGRQHSAHH
jgi:hypothetical protein